MSAIRPSVSRGVTVCVTVALAAFLWAGLASAPADAATSVAATREATGAAAGARVRPDAGHRWILVEVGGLALPTAQQPWPQSLRSLAASGVVGLMPPAQAAAVASNVAEAGAPALDTSKPGEIEQLRQWAATPASAVGVPAAVVVRVGSIAGAGGREARLELDRVASVLGESSSTCVAIVAAPAGGGPMPAALAPVVIACPGEQVAGVITSPLTRRTGVVTGGEVDAAVMSTALGRPDDLLSRAGDRGAKLDDRLAGLRATADTVAAVDSIRWLVFGVWVGSFLALLGLAALVAWLAPPGSAWRRIAALGLLLPLGLPIAAYVTALVARDTGQATPVLVVLGTVTVIVAAATIAAALSRGVAEAATWVLAATALVIVVDQWVGAPLLHANVIGYSLAEGGRFYGLGNEGAGLLLGALTAAVAIRAPSRDAATAPRFAALAGAAFAVALLTCVSPWWGANIGVVLWGTPLLIVAWDGLRPSTWPRSLVGVVAAGVVVVVGALVLADAALGLTHIGRAFVSAISGGSVGAMLAERGSTATRTLFTNPWTIALLTLLAVLAWLVVRPPAVVRQAGETSPALKALLLAALVGSVVAIVTEDTGGSVAAYLEALALTVLLLGLLGPPLAAASPAPEVAP
jgi:hypothetical protein